MKRLFKNQKGFGLLEILITAVFIALMYFYAMKIYRNKQASGKREPETAEDMIIDTAEKISQEADKKIENNEKQIEQLNR